MQNAALPFRSRLPVELEEKEVDRIRRHAADLLAGDAVLRAGGIPHASTFSGPGSGPALVVHDLSETRSPRPEGPSGLEYRGLLLARAGDVVAVGVHRSRAFEAHVQKILGLAELRVVRVERASSGNLAAAALEDGELVSEVVERARAAGSFAVRPYQASLPVWELAAAIARRAGVAVAVEGPPPALTARVNDKLWFGTQAKAVLGPESVPPSAAAEDLEQLIKWIRSLGQGHERVAVRLRSGAGGEGNLVLPMDAVGASSARALRDMLGGLFEILEWDDIFPLQVVVWEAPVLASPSVQLWIPLRGQGAPVVEAVFEQRLEGETAEFAGLTTSTLPLEREREIAHGAVSLGTLFQELGYYGRCSFDTILVGSDARSARLHWVECNGRWGGASIPMTAAERITGDWTHRPFSVLMLRAPGSRRIPCEEALELLSDLLLEPGRDEGVMLVAPTALETGQGLDLMSIAGSRERADALLTAARSRLGRATGARGSRTHRTTLPSGPTEFEAPD